MKKVTVYSTPACGFCKMAKAFFDENKIEYTEHDVSVDEAMRKEMIEKTGQMGVPVIEVDEQVVVGFDKEKLSEMFGL